MSFSPGKLKRYAAYSRDNCRCIYCDIAVIPGAHTRLSNAATIDHVKAQARGGAVYDVRNWVTSCARCNSRKQDKTMRAWYARLANDGHDVVAIRRRVNNSKRRKVRTEAGRALLAS